MTMKAPLRLGPAEEALAAQLEATGDPGAAARFRAAGLPTRRAEAYHYTDLKLLLRDVPSETGGAAEAEATPSGFGVPGAYRVSIVNGEVDLAGAAPARVRARTVAGGVLAERDDVLTRLNSAFCRQSLSLTLGGSISEVIHLDRRISGETAHVNDGAKIFVADGGSAVVVESFSGNDVAHLGNHASHVTLGRNARLTHIVADASDRAVRHFATVEYELAAGAQLHSLVVNDGAALSRTQVFARFAGEGAHADFSGLNLVSGGGHTDITLDVGHLVANTTSTERFKAVARGRSKSVFQGKIVVAKDAQKTDAQMMSNGLMLSDGAEILTKPELEIFADDVICGHGATCGEPDAEQLFYLASRGIPRATAEAMLVRAFIEEVLDPLGEGQLHDALSARVGNWLIGEDGGAR